MEKIEQERLYKAQVEDDMKKLQEQLQGVQSEYENQKTMSRQQLEEQQRELQEKFAQEKQKLVDIEKMKELENQMKLMNEQLQEKDQSL